jgi:hypothetical protein
MVRLYVRFASSTGEMQKGKLLAWERPDCGTYDVGLLDRFKVVKGVRACDMLFLENQEQVDARSSSPDVGSDGDPVPYKRRSCSPLRESRRQKRECPASIFVGVCRSGFRSNCCIDSG